LGLCVSDPEALDVEMITPDSLLMLRILPVTEEDPLIVPLMY
jgi:hypothetical protein